ncbi:hypothetical protein AAHN97_17970 [Chitinophaga niabensis]|uniref:hypothetical protein n=1 Tax=Chitinophaga niabensis TaxID=536979 RepID=UPI0031B9CB2C
MKFIHCIALAILLFGMTACSKVEYTKIDEPAYLRVFNNLNYSIGLANKDEQRPFLTMLIDPVLDKDGMPIGAAVIGDFLDQRAFYAPPYPSHIGSSTSVNNPEYPGKENVLVGPVLNGFDLSSWAQVASGKHRYLFLYRPTNSIPFFNLETSLKKKVLLDTTIQLDAGEVYTMHILQKDFTTKENGILLRQENFHKLPLSDSLLYVNFYNYSSDGFWQADKSLKKEQPLKNMLQYGIKDEMNVWSSLFKGQTLGTAVPGYLFNYMTTIRRNTGTGEVTRYYSIPLFADPASDGISTDIWQRFNILAPGMHPTNMPYNDNADDTHCNYGVISCYSNGTQKPAREESAFMLPNMIVNVHSGTHNPRSFATINTIEFVNGYAYLTTVQRKYPPPVY